MANERAIDFDTLRSAAAHEGWHLTRRQLGGPSGGGVAYVCMRVGSLEGIRSQAAMATQIGSTREESLEQVAAMVRNLSTVLAPDSAEIGVLKVAQRLDGRIKREIKALGSCSHPHLVPIFACAPGEEPDWYIMKYFPGGDLGHRWSEYTGKVIEVLERTRDVAEALSVVHAKGLVHRDIKPENIFITSDGRWVLGDFGIVYEEGATRQTLHGPTPMSKEWRPEWVVSRQVEKFGPVVDLHSLARVAYAMIAGPGKNPAVSHLDESDFDLRQLHPTVDHIDAVQQFFMDHITHKESQSKSKTAQEFIGRIDELLALYRQRRRSQQVLSVVIPASAGWIGPANLGLGQNLRLHLPPGISKLRGSLCFYSEERTTGEIELSVRDKYVHLRERHRITADPDQKQSFLDSALALHKAEVLFNENEKGSLGLWWDFELPISKPLPSLAFFNVERSPGPSITAIMLTVEYLA